MSLLIVAFRRLGAASFPESLQSRRFLSSTLCDKMEAKVVQSDEGGDRDQTVFPTCLHHPPLYSYLHYSPFPVWVYVWGAGLSALALAAGRLRRGPDMGGPQVRSMGGRGWGQGRGFESRVSNWTQC